MTDNNQDETPPPPAITNNNNNGSHNSNQNNKNNNDGVSYCQECSIALTRRSPRRQPTTNQNQDVADACDVLDPCVNLHPCGCVFCTHCFIQYLASSLVACTRRGKEKVHDEEETTSTLLLTCPACEPFHSHLLLKRRQLSSPLLQSSSYTTIQFDYRNQESVESDLLLRQQPSSQQQQAASMVVGNNTSTTTVVRTTAARSRRRSGNNRKRSAAEVAAHPSLPPPPHQAPPRRKDDDDNDGGYYNDYDGTTAANNNNNKMQEPSTSVSHKRARRKIAREEDDEENNDDEKVVDVKNNENDDDDDDSLKSDLERPQPKNIIGWKERMGQLREYKARTGSCHFPPSSYHELSKHRGLLNWVESIRFGRKRITKGQRQQLDKLNFDWKLPEVTFDERVAQLKRYNNTFHGTRTINDINVDDPDYPNLALWLWDIRQKQSKSKLNFVQWSQLEELGLQIGGWRKKSFDERFAELVEHKDKLGHCNVHYNYKGSDSLSNYVQRIRSGEKKVTDAQRERLDAIGFSWETRREKLNKWWDKQFDKLLQFKATHGHVRVPWEWKEDKKLSEWCHTQRCKWKKGQLPKDRIERLEKIGFVWEPSLNRQKAGGGGTGKQGDGSAAGTTTGNKRRKKQHPRKRSQAEAAATAVPEAADEDHSTNDVEADLADDDEQGEEKTQYYVQPYGFI